MKAISQFRPLLASVPLLTLGLPASAAIAATTIPEPAKLLPDNPAYVIFINTRDETWQQLEQYAFFQYLMADDETVLNPGGLPFLPPELDYQTDIAPWIGDTAAIALLPLGRPRVTVMQEHEVLITPIAQAEAFAGFIETVTDLRGSEPDRQKYQTFDILYWEPQFEEPPVDGALSSPLEPEAWPEPSPFENELLKALPETVPDIPIPESPVPVVPGLAIAVFPDFIVAAEHPAAVRAWINHRPRDYADSLAASDRFLRTLARPNFDQSLSVFYGELSEILKYSLADLTLPNFPVDLPLSEQISPQELVQLASLQIGSTIEVLLYPAARGIRLQGRSYYDDSILQGVAAAVQPAPTDVLQQVPGDTMGLLSSHNLAVVWQEVATALEASETTSSYLQQARGLFTAFTGLDLDQDVFGWMDQGFSVFLFPTAHSPLTTFVPELEIGLGIALQTSDRPRAEATLATLDELGKRFFTVETSAINDNLVTSWGTYLDWDDQPDSFLGHGWASEDTLLLTTSLGSLSDILALEPAQTLPNAFRFSQSIQDFPEQNQGYLYTNFSPIQTLFTRFFPVDLNDQAALELRQVAGSVQAFTGTLSFNEDYLQMDGMLMLAPAER